MGVSAAPAELKCGEVQLETVSKSYPSFVVSHFCFCFLLAVPSCQVQEQRNQLSLPGLEVGEDSYSYPETETSQGLGSAWQPSRAWDLLETYSQFPQNKRLLITVAFQIWAQLLKAEVTSDLERLSLLCTAWRQWHAFKRTGPLVSWKRLVEASLQKLRKQVALESLVDALDARAARAQDSHTEATTGAVQKLLTQVSFIAWKSWCQAETYRKEMGEVRDALSSTESCARVMLRDVVTDLHSNYDLLGCMLIFRSWYSLLVNQRHWNCQRGYMAWARLRKDGIPKFTADLETISLLSAAWGQWHLFAKNGPRIKWRHLVQSALQRLGRQVALESLVDALDDRAARWQWENHSQRPILMYDVLAAVWLAWRAWVGESGTGWLARWRRLALTFLRKERHQVALESLVDALDARAARAQDSHTEATTGAVQKLLTQVSFIAWKSWCQAETYRKEMGEVRDALSSTESCARVMLRDVVTDLHSNYDLLGCMLIFRSWYSLLVNQRHWNCQRGYMAWARLRKDGIPKFTADLETISLLSAAWGQWHLFAKNGPRIKWRHLVQSALQRLGRQVALESLVDALDDRAARWQWENHSQRPILMYDVLAAVWLAWRAWVGESGTGWLARWRRLALTFLRKERHQVALESLVDALANADQDIDFIAVQVAGPISALFDLGLVFRCWRLATGHHLAQTSFNSAFSELKIHDSNWLKLQAAFLQWSLEIKSFRQLSRRSLMTGLERAVRLQQCREKKVQREWLLHSTFWAWKSACVGRQCVSDLSHLSPIRLEDSMNSTYLSPKQPEEEDVPLGEHAGQPEEEQAPPTIYQPFITPTSGHTRTDSEEGPRLTTLDLFDQFDLQRPEPISAREEEIQRRIYLKRHFFLEGVMRRWVNQSDFKEVSQTVNSRFRILLGLYIFV